MKKAFLAFILFATQPTLSYDYKMFFCDDPWCRFKDNCLGQDCPHRYEEGDYTEDDDIGDGTGDSDYQDDTGDDGGSYGRDGN
jgi:hypothetical protein